MAGNPEMLKAEQQTENNPNNKTSSSVFLNSTPTCDGYTKHTNEFRVSLGDVSHSQGKREEPGDAVRQSCFP
jgi:hypothetical protein